MCRATSARCGRRHRRRGSLVFLVAVLDLSALSWWYDSTVSIPRQGRRLPQPDYDLTTLPWQLAQPRVFDVNRRDH